jgi:hypothetical protein
MPFAWAAISVHNILKAIEQENNEISSYSNALSVSKELINSSVFLKTKKS